jgi:hypothetical protein
MRRGGNSMANKRIKFARRARPTRKSEALLLSAYAQRWAQQGKE